MYSITDVAAKYGLSEIDVIKMMNNLGIELPGSVTQKCITETDYKRIDCYLGYEDRG